jgi:hypothetical protein
MLATVAGIMSLRPEMKFPEKVAWVLLLIIFAYLEVKAIKRGDADNKDARDKQTVEFNAIASGLSSSISASQNQYHSTITHVDDVSTETKSVAELAKANLRNVTGGDSYAYIIPVTSDRTAQALNMVLHNAGGNMLTGVTVRIAAVIKESCPGTPAGPGCTMTTDQGPMKPYEIGTLYPHGESFMTNWIVPQPFPEGKGHHVVMISAQNGLVVEDLWFRPANKDGGWAYRYSISRVPPSRNKEGQEYNLFVGAVLLHSSEWIEPSKPQ